MATIVVIIFIGILLIFVAGNARTLDYLRREIKLIDTKQNQRLKAGPAPATNAPAAQPPPVERPAQP